MLEAWNSIQFSCLGQGPDCLNSAAACGSLHSRELGWTAEHPGCLLQDVDSSLDPVPAPSKWMAGETLSSLLIVFGLFIKIQLIKKIIGIGIYWKAAFWHNLNDSILYSGLYPSIHVKSVSLALCNHISINTRLVVHFWWIYLFLPISCCIYYYSFVKTLNF